jgi:hypothetical protein
LLGFICEFLFDSLVGARYAKHGIHSRS